MSDDLLHAVTRSLDSLRSARTGFVIRAESLLADLALVGLVDDLLDNAGLALDLCQRASPVAAFPATRTAFESAQRVIVLATDDDYLGVGVRAWLYYQRKHRRVLKHHRGPDVANAWFDSLRQQWLDIWSVYNEDAGALFEEQNGHLDGFRGRADNFMGQDLSEIVDERHIKLATSFGRAAQPLRAINLAIYAALSLESHAKVRSDVAGLKIARDGSATLIPRQIDQAAKQRQVLGCLDSSLMEANAALGHLLARRRTEKIGRAAQTAAVLTRAPLPACSKPDLGLYLMQNRGAETNFHFANVPVTRLGVLPDGTVSWSASLPMDQAEYLATFDVPQRLAATLASAIGLAAVDLAPAAQIREIGIAGGVVPRLVCKLGAVQQSEAHESFAPLVVSAIARSPQH